MANQFRLYRHDLNNDTFKLVKEIKDREGLKFPGIMVLSLSKSNLELSTGKAISWQSRTNFSKPSFYLNLFAESEIEVVPTQAKLRTQLSGTPIN